MDAPARVATTPQQRVKSIPAIDDRVARGMLRTYYVDDRILAWDASPSRTCAVLWTEEVVPPARSVIVGDLAAREAISQYAP